MISITKSSKPFVTKISITMGSGGSSGLVLISIDISIGDDPKFDDSVF